jgi:WD40 repeat protein
MAVKGDNIHVNPSSITSICTDEKETGLWVVTHLGQLVSAKVELRGEMPNKVDFDYVQCAFHKREITGLDTCLRKPLLVTCSKDRTVCLWNYKQMTLEATLGFNEDCTSVALHPSGQHLVVATNEKVEFFNILSESMQRYDSLNIKGCTEMAFASGGHLLACIVN